MKRLLCALLGLLAVLSLFTVPAISETPLTVTYVLPEGGVSENLTDRNVMTRITLEGGETIELLLSDAGEDASLYIEWFALPEEVTVTLYDAEKTVLSEVEIGEEAEWGTRIALEPACVRVVLEAETECFVSFMTVVRGEPDFPWFGEVPEAAELLFVLAEPNDVTELVGNLLVKYRLEHGVQVGIVLLSDGRRYELAELAEVLDALGISEAPIFVHCKDKEYNAADEVHNSWSKADPVRALAALLEELRPSVVVCPPETSGNVRHGETNALLKEALTVSAHAVSKVYELDANGATVVDCSEGSPVQNGNSAAAVAQEAYRLCRSRGVYRYDIPAAARLTLYASTVGADADCTDLLEHLDTASFASYVNVTPSPVPTEVPTETPVPTATPTEQPVVTEAPTIAPTDEPKRRGLFSCAGEEVPVLTEEPTKTPTEAPTERPTAEPSEEPTAEPTENPSPTMPLSAFDAHFYQEGKGESVTIDAQKGEWNYRNENLAVEIRRYETVYYRTDKAEPVVYFVADIYQRNYDSFRPVFGSEHHNGIATTGAMQMADKMQCVLWLTGDNIIQSDKEAKGILIRDGYVFQRTNRIDCCSLNSETLSLDLVHRSGNTAERVIDSGAQNVFSFGPILVENGEIPENARTSRSKLNPRTAIGMVEPGHLVAVVVDGRQPGYSLGVSGGELAELMLAHGCVSAYNLDGGISATMIFLGNKINRHGEEDYYGVQSSPRVMPDGLTWGYSPAHYGAYRNPQ